MSAETIASLCIVGAAIIGHAIQQARMTKAERRAWEDRAYYAFHP